MAKIAILSHFGSWRAGYALHVGWRERARLLARYGVDFDFLVDETCPSGTFPHQLNVLRKADAGTFADKAAFYAQWYSGVLNKYDIIITPDIFYQVGGDFLAYNAGLRAAQAHRQVPWVILNWMHSAWLEPRGLEYPDSLRFAPIPNSITVYMNSAELEGAARMHSAEHVHCVHNPKDPRTFFNLHEDSIRIANKLRFWEKDFIQLAPACSTRVYSKGLIPVLNTFAELKRRGNNIALVLALSSATTDNGSFNELLLQERIEDLGLSYADDIVITSMLFEDKRDTPREVIADLFRLSNVYIAASWRDVCPNSLIEAAISGNYLLINRRVPALLEIASAYRHFAFDGTARIPGSWDADADNIIGDDDKLDITPLADAIEANAISKRNIWEFSHEVIWEREFKPLLEKASKLIGGARC